MTAMMAMVQLFGSLKLVQDDDDDDDDGPVILHLETNMSF